jgi:hypothetical protein
LKTSPLPRPDPPTAEAHLRRGRGKGRRCERYQRTRHYRPQGGKKRNEFLYELSKPDTRSVMKKPCFLERTRVDTALYSEQGGFPSPVRRAG